jgi:SARP family transcriptional regulator, regulator of embCAB operon
MLRFNVLGRLEIIDGGIDRTPTAPMVCQVLALLLLRANTIVSLDSIIDELWDGNPPRSATPTAQTYIYLLRRQFGEWLPEDAVRDMLVTRANGYILRVSPSQTDLDAFTQLSDRGRAALVDDDPAAAAQFLRQALALWSGPVLANVTHGRLIEGHIVRLEEMRSYATELRIQADAMLGRHRELVGELRAMLVEDPLNEWCYMELIKALARSGRRHQALDAFQNLRRVLSAELGLEPSDQLKELHRGILTGAIMRDQPVAVPARQGR